MIREGGWHLSGQQTRFCVYVGAFKWADTEVTEKEREHREKHAAAGSPAAVRHFSVVVFFLSVLSVSLICSFFGLRADALLGQNIYALCFPG
ncbi:MAG: hypothetical protein WCI17_04745 [bacterium]